MDFVRKNTESIGSSIFWSQLRHDFATRFVEGKAEVTGWRGKIYDPRIGEYRRKISKVDKIFMRLSQVVEIWSLKIRRMVSQRAWYERAYINLNIAESLPKDCRLYSHPVLRVGKNCAIHPHLIRAFSYFSELYKYCKHFGNRDSVLGIGGGLVRCAI